MHATSSLGKKGRGPGPDSLLPPHLVLWNGLGKRTTFHSYLMCAGPGFGRSCIYNMTDTTFIVFPSHQFSNSPHTNWVI